MAEAPWLTIIGLGEDGPDGLPPASRAALDAARLQRDFAELRAPADGVISKRLIQPGQVVSAGSELLRLIRDGRLEWRAELPASQLAAVKPGDVIPISFGAEVPVMIGGDHVGFGAVGTSNGHAAIRITKLEGPNR